ncbi:IclR family transcriptional regulator [Lutibaculum baratangense]|uniref:Transcriptional regulator, IclR family n=1 Tax=Lutibaculum baratangense AMV1 TaxID=631454 RepID=V4RLD6_9HYPH|nr:IclR family transcriptional regulator [Lutibaculum baratangense]ESR26866.1 Transcriptional regulator, IclR family [Lutibaculum baratangense AMV1]
MARTATQTKAKEAGAPRERGGVQSLERAASILDVVARHRDGASLAQLSVETGLHSSTAFHLLKTLVALGFVAQVPESKRYRVGSRLFGLAAGALDETTLLSLASPVLERLSTATGEASHLAIRSRHEIVVVARMAATGLLQMSDRTGSSRPAHATAIGKTLLAAMPDADLDRLLATLPLPAFTPSTITDPVELRREIDRVRERGIAHDDGELDRDVRCIALPVHDFAGRVAAAIGISAPVWRLSIEMLEEKVDHLRSAAQELSGLIGGDSSAHP